jgi:hypothetical protein
MVGMEYLQSYKGLAVLRIPRNAPAAMGKISEALSDPDRVEFSLVMQSHCLLLDLSVRAPFT